MPSTTSSSVSRLLDSSTVITPSLPTFFMASAILAPISVSPLAEMVPTCAISSLEVTFLAFFLSSATTAATARSTPRFRSIGLAPAATDLAPSLTMAWASTVAVVVPSPARSDVLDATSRSICAPMFSNLSSSSISLATVTPSLVMRGAPNDFSMTTLRPFGPSETFTALARISTPRSILSRASVENRTSFAAIFISSCYLWKFRGGLRRSGRLLGRRGRAFDDAHDVGFLHDEEVLTVDLDLGAGPLAEEDAVALLDVERDQLAVFVAGAGADGDDLAFLRLLLGGVGDDDAAFGAFFAFDALDDDAVVQRTEVRCHWASCLAGRPVFWRPGWVETGC